MIISTRSLIGIINKDDSVDTIYCHWDGYPSNQGPLLTQFYNTADKVRDLIALGGISYLAEKLEPTTGSHSFEHPEQNVVVAYHRDRGEDWEHNKSAHFANIDELISDIGWEDYVYLFDVRTESWRYAPTYKLKSLHNFLLLTEPFEE